MNKRGAGVILCAVGMFTLVSRYIVSAIYSQGNWESFWRLDNVVKNDFLIFGFIFLAVGIIFVFLEEIKGIGKRKKHDDNYKSR